MSFHFSLQAVLRVRQLVEQNRELLVRAANDQLVMARQDIEQLDFYLAELVSSSARELSVGLNAVQLHFNELCRSELLERRRKLKKELDRCEEVLACQRQAFHHARSQRKVLDQLQDQQLGLYRQNQERREQQQLD